MLEPLGEKEKVSAPPGNTLLSWFWYSHPLLVPPHPAPLSMFRPFLLYHSHFPFTLGLLSVRGPDYPHDFNEHECTDYYNSPLELFACVQAGISWLLTGHLPLFFPPGISNSPRPNGITSSPKIVPGVTVVQLGQKPLSCWSWWPPQSSSPSLNFTFSVIPSFTNAGKGLITPFVLWTATIPYSLLYLARVGVTKRMCALSGGQGLCDTSGACSSFCP